MSRGSRNTMADAAEFTDEDDFEGDAEPAYVPDDAEDSDDDDLQPGDFDDDDFELGASRTRAHAAEQCLL